MDKHERTRIATRQCDPKDDVEAAYVTLTLADLLRLLHEDDSVRAAIRDIVTTPAIETSSAKRETNSVSAQDTDNDSNCVPQPSGTGPGSTDTLRQQLAPELALLQAVRADADLAAAWLHGQTDEGRQLLQLVVCAAQWDVLSDLWDKLASRCKQGQRAARADELYILQTSLALHNLRWRDRQARLVDVAAGTIYDYERHQRGTTSGDTVRAQWLPGLQNAGGHLHKKPLVQT